MHINKSRTLTGIGVVILFALSTAGYLAYSTGYFADEMVFSTEAGAIDGYDPVAYFTEGAATKGSDRITAEHAGAVWRFATSENRQAFLASPDKYKPQYGGFCAFGMSEGYTAYTDPNAWTVLEGRLYLNYSVDVKADWEQNRAQRIVTADGHWEQRMTGFSANE